MREARAVYSRLRARIRSLTKTKFVSVEPGSVDGNSLAHRHR